MGSDAARVAGALEAALAARLPSLTWTTERYVGRTPVDVAGEGDGEDAALTLVELEWRRADPADNTVTLFRHLDAGEIGGDVCVVQLFTRYYDLQSGGVASKRKNAEFVGDLAAETFADVGYHALTLDVDPPKRGGELPDDWRNAVGTAADRIANRL
ncbi:hypothetical protein HWV07_12175 [Natronomonas salina]|uniref:hypothetical protein n=1 Tax=Natronomonas salina TaxID=1710540 RepID=UPI0015B5DEFB|nr:hypothetical protein [Natronomonas salina]QLD89743.1 hypothetical protein HWV07_12175 [Natronomonas salina]